MGGLRGGNAGVCWSVWLPGVGMSEGVLVGAKRSFGLRGGGVQHGTTTLVRLSQEYGAKTTHLRGYGSSNGQKRRTAEGELPDVMPSTLVRCFPGCFLTLILYSTFSWRGLPSTSNNSLSKGCCTELLDYTAEVRLQPE